MDYREKVYKAVSSIPNGRVSTYKEIACAFGDPNLARAVGNALNKNPDPAKVPCYRVVKSDGSIGGFKWGLQEKIRLLSLEGIIVKKEKVVGFKELMHKPRI